MEVLEEAFPSATLIISTLTINVSSFTTSAGP